MCLFTIIVLYACLATCPTLQWVQKILEVALPIFRILKYFLRYFDSNIQLIKLKTHPSAIEEHFGELMESFF